MRLREKGLYYEDGGKTSFVEAAETVVVQADHGETGQDVRVEPTDWVCEHDTLY